ncbi:hypothetical protein D9615_005868 [Tricholomella constricta]|uniref:Uncharacterized protein n=1 Tax=Tricholomella constricta TaxID=117010 RepID=A0A8H5M3D5_9AGAR|nr:hypothetical protein D9615_005868 [Tricholomella constricta]
MYHSRVVVLALIVLWTSLQLVTGAPLFHSSDMQMVNSPSAQFDETPAAFTSALNLPPHIGAAFPGLSSSSRQTETILDVLPESSSLAVDERRTEYKMTGTLYIIPEWIGSLTKRSLLKPTRSTRRRHHRGRHP